MFFVARGSILSVGVAAVVGVGVGEYVAAAVVGVGVGKYVAAAVVGAVTDITVFVPGEFGSTAFVSGEFGSSVSLFSR